MRPWSPTVVGLLGLTLVSCSPETPQDRIRETIAEAEAAAEARDADRLGDLLADGFLDVAGRNRSAVLGYLRLYLRGTESVYVLTRIREIRLVDDSTAEVTLVAAVAERRVEGRDDLAGVEADLWRFRLELRETAGGRWLVTSADWRRIGLRDF